MEKANHVSEFAKMHESNSIKEEDVKEIMIPNYISDTDEFFYCIFTKENCCRLFVFNRDIIFVVPDFPSSSPIRYRSSS